jgi:hypothetical protein
MTFFRKFSIVLAILVAVAIYVLFFWDYSKGSRFGKLVKLSQRGVVFKEWEGVIDQGSGDRLTWSFSIHDKAMAEELEKQMGEVVQLDYREHFNQLWYATKYDVYSWRIKNINRAKLCPFLYLLRSDKETLKKASDLIGKERKDLVPEIEACLVRLNQLKD